MSFNAYTRETEHEAALANIVHDLLLTYPHQRMVIEGITTGDLLRDHPERLKADNANVVAAAVLLETEGRVKIEWSNGETRIFMRVPIGFDTRSRCTLPRVRSSTK